MTDLHLVRISIGLIEPFWHTDTTIAGTPAGYSRHSSGFDDILMHFLWLLNVEASHDQVVCTTKATSPVSAPELSFVIPTYRLRDVSETITQYDKHFWRNGHAVRMIVFDNSTPATQAGWTCPEKTARPTRRSMNNVMPVFDGRSLTMTFLIEPRQICDRRIDRHAL